MNWMMTDVTVLLADCAKTGDSMDYCALPYWLHVPRQVTVC
jgi:uncharacterized lipoprotein YmbA